MCGRFGFIYPSAEDWAESTADLAYSEKLKKAYDEELPQYARTNIAPTQTVPTIVYSEKEKTYLMVPMRWGWEPLWRPNGQIHNGNLQTILDPHKTTWKKDFATRRCLIPASFFYDWQQRDDAVKFPWKIERADGKLIFFAGLFQYDTLRKNRNEKVLTTVIITQHGNKLMQALNNSDPPGTQPVILDYDTLSHWLNPQIKDPRVIAKLIRIYSEQEIQVTPLEKIGNDNTKEPPQAREWIDPYAVKTAYCPNPQ